MDRELRKAQMLRTFNDAQHKPAQVEGREVAVPIPGGSMRALCYHAPKPQRDCYHAPKLAPLFVDIHGGAFIFGSPEEDDAFCASLCRTLGVTVVSLDYPLAPEARFPEALHRIYDAIESLRGDARRWGIDPENVSVGGHSVGGCMATAVCLLAKRRGGPRLRCQVLDHPALDMGGTIPPERKHRDELALSQALLDFGARCYAGREQFDADPLCTPCVARTEELEGLPPAIVLTCGRDSMRTEGEIYAGMLVAAGVEVSFRRFAEEQHGFTVFPGPRRAEGQRFLFENLRRYI